MKKKSYNTVRAEAHLGKRSGSRVCSPLSAIFAFSLFKYSRSAHKETL